MPRSDSNSVLVLTYDFPPCSAPGAAVRSEKLVKYLPEFGWEPRVICRAERIEAAIEERVIRVPTPVSPRISYQLGAWAWAQRILAPARKSIRDWRPDLIYASFPPFPHSLAAVRLSREAGIPLVADFRDAWSLDPHLGGGVLKRACKKALCGWVYPSAEEHLMASASAIILNTPSMDRAYRTLYECFQEKLYLIPNGFDEADFDGPVRAAPRSRPRLLYSGRFSGVGARSPEILLKAMRLLVDRGRSVELQILGDDAPALRRSVQRLGLAGSVTTSPAVSLDSAIRAMRQADVLVVYQEPSRNSVTPVASKTFAYLRTGRPIVAIVPPGDNADLVRDHAGAHAIVSDRDPQSVAAAIEAVLDRPEGAREPSPEFRETYNRRRIAQQVGAIFDAVTGREESHGRSYGQARP